MNSEVAKKAVGEAAAELIHDDMLVGLGSGTTVFYFVKKLADRCQNGLKIQTVVSSKQTEKLAESLKIPIADINSFMQLDISVDGADEIDPQKRMIKGGGGALLREKIMAKMSRHRITIVDSSKCVSQLGGFPLAVEIFPFGWKST